MPTTDFTAGMQYLQAFRQFYYVNLKLFSNDTHRDCYILFIYGYMIHVTNLISFLYFLLHYKKREYVPYQ